MYFVDRTAVVLKPTQAFLNWLKGADADMPALTLNQLQSNCTTYLVPEFDSPEAVVAYVDEHFAKWFELELAAWEVERRLWPQTDLQTFWALFSVEIHDTVLDTQEEDIQVSPLSEN